MTSEGLGRCLKVTLQKQAPENFGQSGVRALPLAAGIKEGGHYFMYFSSSFLFLFLPPLFKTTEVVVVGFQSFAWAPK